jgi:hypothetical protein
VSYSVTGRSQHRARSATHMDPTRRNSIMLRTVALIALVCSASATDVSAHARMSEIGKGLMSALSRIEPADDFSRRSLLQLDASFCGFMTTSLTCAFIADSASCASTTGCALNSGECTIDITQYDTAEVVLLAADTNFVAMTAKMTSCDAKSATQCSADITCDFDGSCVRSSPYFIFWVYDKCPTMATVIVEFLVAEGITQAHMQEEADAAGFTISPELQAEMDAQGMASSAKTLSSAFVTTVAAAALAFA